MLRLVTVSTTIASNHILLCDTEPGVRISTKDESEALYNMELGVCNEIYSALAIIETSICYCAALYFDTRTGLYQPRIASR